MVPDSNTWRPPVQFHFRVVFQWDGSESSASFSEVDGLGQSLRLDTRSGGDKDGLPQINGVMIGDLVLKRAIEPLDEEITRWVKECFDFLNGGRIRVCNVSVSLLDENGTDELARWKCLRAIPVKWRVAPLNASESRIAVETLTLKYKELIREK